ncbi:Hypothetical predicted protein [Xyrichtys novacula]|uniref:Uncharacterized protein n=1 Tax=Xyrichtys novacula TaxID=13765 RepID=A0AAV1HGZ4_XYRNO|nr:Hypothetical predicted protein [Xyrichtys novacula]
MLLRVKPFAAVSKQLPRDFASDERLGAGGGGEEESEERGRKRTSDLQETGEKKLASLAPSRLLGGSRPVDCKRKPGAGFKMSQGRAGCLVMKAEREGESGVSASWFSTHHH